MTKLRYVECWAVVELQDGTPAVVTSTQKRGWIMVKIGRDHGRWVRKDEEVLVLAYAAESAHMFLENVLKTRESVSNAEATQ